MYLIKQYFIINSTIRKIINLLLKSNELSYNIGFEFALLYYCIYKESGSNMNSVIQNFLLNINKKDYIIIKLFNPLINYTIFFEKFNKQLFKLPNNILGPFFRGYYINNLYLYGTNITLFKEIRDSEEDISKIYYFVLYDFHNLYLEHIYSQILKLSKFPCKIKFLRKSAYDKYSINDITDDINYKLVFLHKSKYYNNSIKYIFQYLFEDISKEKNIYANGEILMRNSEDKNIFALLSEFLLK